MVGCATHSVCIYKSYSVSYLLVGLTRPNDGVPSRIQPSIFVITYCCVSVSHAGPVGPPSCVMRMPPVTVELSCCDMLDLHHVGLEW